MPLKIKTLIFLILTSFFLPVLSSHAETLEEQLSEPAPPAVAPPSWEPRLEEARALAKNEEDLKAREIYASLLEEGGLGEQEKEIRREFETLNMKLIFSPVETPESTFHEVAPGDNLSGLAKKYKTTVTLLKKSNRLDSADKIYVGKKLKVPKAPFSILIKKQENELVLSAEGRPIKTYSVATGEGGSTPVGTFSIVNKLENPTWYHAGAIVPPDSPKNILGSRWLGFDKKGYGIHGTTLPETIGHQASKGCIRMLNSDAEELYDLIPLGAPVEVVE